MQRRLLTTQTCSTGLYAEFFQETLLSQMHTESGELDRPQSSISITRLRTDTDRESQDTCSGMDQ
jgi:hypothetical protein